MAKKQENGCSKKGESTKEKAKRYYKVGGIESSIKKDVSRKAEVESFTKPKSTIMIEGQKDSGAGEVDNGGEGLLDSRRKR